MVHAVDEEEVVGRYLQPSHLHQTQESQRELYHIIALHAQCAAHACTLLPRLQLDACLGSEGCLCLAVGIDDIHSLGGQTGRVCSTSHRRTSGSRSTAMLTRGDHEQRAQKGYPRHTAEQCVYVCFHITSSTYVS